MTLFRLSNFLPHFSTSLNTKHSFKKTPNSFRSKYLKKNYSMDSNYSPIKRSIKLDFQWDTQDPFLFCVHHLDYYPAGNEHMGPDKSLLRGRNIGSDFTVKDGFRMYHGDVVPGFPAHPHRGFETVTVVLRGLIDHADSMGASGRYGNGDVQWMTAGRGVQHSEMFPLLDPEGDNTLELFQIWINLPAENKMVDPCYKMIWSEDVPIVEHVNDEGKMTRVKVVAGKLDGVVADKYPPNSWAANEENHVSIYIIDMDAGATWDIPAGPEGLNRTLYYFEGEGTANIGGRQTSKMTGLYLHSDRECQVQMGDHPGRLLMLEGRPIDEPVVQYGSFVMNTREEIMQCYLDYQRTEFGGWPYQRKDPVHPRTKGRFATHADGTEEVRD